jgi:hypothetical protein
MHLMWVQAHHIDTDCYDKFFGLVPTDRRTRAHSDLAPMRSTACLSTCHGGRLAVPAARVAPSRYLDQKAKSAHEIWVFCNSRDEAKEATRPPRATIALLWRKLACPKRFERPGNYGSTGDRRARFMPQVSSSKIPHPR